MIYLDEITKDYQGKTALHPMSTHLAKGELAFLTGHSGAGKSTLLRLILGAEQASSGRVQVGGFQLSRITARSVPYFRRNIGVVFQDFKLIPSRTVFENVALTLEVLGLSPKRIRRLVYQTLIEVGLDDMSERSPLSLSGGEQQRVAIARSIINDPLVLLADEPTGNLDPAMSLEIMEILAGVALRGTTVLIATHNHELMRPHPRARHLELAEGRLVWDGPVDRNGSLSSYASLPAIDPMGT